VVSVGKHNLRSRTLDIAPDVTSLFLWDQTTYGRVLFSVPPRRRAYRAGFTTAPPTTGTPTATPPTSAFLSACLQSVLVFQVWTSAVACALRVANTQLWCVYAVHVAYCRRANRIFRAVAYFGHSKTKGAATFLQYCSLGSP